MCTCDDGVWCEPHLEAETNRAAAEYFSTVHPAEYDPRDAYEPTDPKLYALTGACDE